MTETRAAIERAVRELIRDHVPALWRARASMYVPLVVDRLTAAVEAIRENHVA